jgi:hypothetical protein
MKRSVINGSISALVSMFPTAFLLALFWRFPIPFSGYESGISGAIHSLLAVIIYGFLGGFLVIPGLGAAAGALAYKLSKGNKTVAIRFSIVFGILCAVRGGVFLSLLDTLIGSW